MTDSNPIPGSSGPYRITPFSFDVTPPTDPEIDSLLTDAMRSLLQPPKPDAIGDRVFSTRESQCCKH